MVVPHVLIKNFGSPIFVQIHEIHHFVGLFEAPSNADKWHRVALFIEQEHEMFKPGLKAGAIESEGEYGVLLTILVKVSHAEVKGTHAIPTTDSYIPCSPISGASTYDNGTFTTSLARSRCKRSSCSKRQVGRNFPNIEVSDFLHRKTVLIQPFGADWGVARHYCHGRPRTKQ